MYIYRVTNISASHPRFRRRTSVLVEDLATENVSKLNFGVSRIIGEKSFIDLQKRGLVSLDKDPSKWEKRVRLFAEQIKATSKKKKDEDVPDVERLNLFTYAKETYGVDLDSKKKTEELKEEVAQLDEDKKLEQEEMLKLIAYAKDTYDVELDPDNSIEELIEKVMQLDEDAKEYAEKKNECDKAVIEAVDKDDLKGAIDILAKLIETDPDIAEDINAEESIVLLEKKIEEDDNTDSDEDPKPEEEDPKTTEEVTGKEEDKIVVVEEKKEVVAGEGTEEVTTEELKKEKKVDEVVIPSVQELFDSGLPGIRKFKTEHDITMPGWSKKTLLEKAEFLVNYMNDKKNEPK